MRHVCAVARDDVDFAVLGNAAVVEQVAEFVDVHVKGGYSLNAAESVAHRLRKRYARLSRACRDVRIDVAHLPRIRACRLEPAALRPVIGVGGNPVHAVNPISVVPFVLARGVIDFI